MRRHVPPDIKRGRFQLFVYYDWSQIGYRNNTIIILPVHDSDS